MERIVYRKTLDVHKNGVQFTLQGFETADKMSRRIEISLMASGDTIDIPLEQIKAMMYVTTPYATEPSINDCTIKDNKIIYDVLPIVEEGITEMQLKLIETSVEGAKSVLATPRFAVEVTKGNADDEDAMQTKTFTALEDAVAKATEVYASRLLRIELDSDCMFRAYYADGNVYETDILKELFLKGDALLSESFAKGGTGVRAGEDTDNSMYYSNVSRSASEDSKRMNEDAKDVLTEVRKHGVYTAFRVDFESGEVKYISPNYRFEINEETGELDAIGDTYSPDELRAKKRYLLIGDSYGQGARSQVGIKGWAPLFKEKMGLHDDDCIINTLGGTGFCNGASKSGEGIIVDEGIDASKEYRFIDLLYSTATMTEIGGTRYLSVSETFPVENPETITDIVVCGGYNDMNYNNSEIALAINDFVVKAKELYPNALVSIGMVGCSGKTNEALITQKLAVNSLAGYAGVLSSSNSVYRYLNNVEYVLKLNPVYMYEEGLSDGIHPTSFGYKALANAVTKAVMGGFTAGYASHSALLKAASGITLLDNPYCTVKINNAITEIYGDALSFVFENQYNLNANDLIELAEFDPSTSLITGTRHDPENGVYNRTGFVSVTGHFQEYDSGKFHMFVGKAGVVNGKIYLIPIVLNSENSSYATNIPIRNLQIHQLHITTATNLY